MVFPSKHVLPYSQAVCWQDTTMRLWDMRRPGCAVGMVRGIMAAPRSIRFSPDGRLCAMAEAADFVHIIDVQSGFTRCGWPRVPRNGPVLGGSL